MKLTKKLTAIYLVCIKLSATYNTFCIPTTFNDPLKDCFSKNNFFVTIETQIVNNTILFEKLVFIGAKTN